MRELYSRLGFTEEESRLQGDEFQKLCKKKFRELSKEWHPDRWSSKSEDEKKKAEEKFKEINEANEILSDPEKRRVYDLTGSTNGQFNGDGGGFDGFNPFGGFDPFENIFGHRNRQRVQRGSDVRVEINLTLQEAFTGVKKTVTVPLEEKCSQCGGTGSADSKSTECPHCHGTGFVTHVQIMGNTRVEQRSICPHCHGTGKIITNPCPRCHGTGVEHKNVQKTIEIPAGVFSGVVMSIQGEGNMPEGGNGIKGDLQVVITVGTDPNYERVENDIMCNLELTLLEAWLGCKKNVYNIDGKHYILSIAPSTKDGTILTVAFNQGFTDVNFGTRGSFRVKVKYKMPKSLTKEQVKLLEEFYDLENKK